MRSFFPCFFFSLFLLLGRGDSLFLNFFDWSSKDQKLRDFDWISFKN
uniref:Uncharacterized protein n=1 Tax=Rhizophora mucronata TaxID=61149 RepID=A0A2P2NER1_RHIMU